ncbi:MAG: sugar ABC transporter permease [Paenibacillaceae bacterium]
MERNRGVLTGAGDAVAFAGPSLLLFSLFIIYPFFSGMHLSFTDWDGISSKIRYIGLSNFTSMFQSRVFYSAVINTLKLTIIVAVIQNLLGLLLAVLLDKKMKGHTFYKTAIFMPALLSTVVVGIVCSIIFSPFNGTLNTMLDMVGLHWLADVNWLGNPDTALYAIMFTGIWQWTGFSMIIYLAALQAVPSHLLEAGMIDGAGAFRRFFHIELPSIAPAITINTVLSVIGCLKTFETILVMTGGGPGNATQVVGTYIYTAGLSAGRMGYGSAISLVLFAGIVLITLIQVRLLRKREEHL